jgi:hydrogenase/urease accessory protein HupE
VRGRLVSLFALSCLVALAVPSTAFAHGIHGEAETVPEFIRLGIRHMVVGWDHLLFIIGVVLLARGLFRAAKLVSLFVGGHSLTLLVATLAGWKLNAELVDVVIALSLAYVGWRLLAGRPTVWRGTQLAVFGFGLVHGLGLSTRLQDQPLPDGGALVARILAFNLGVEIGQLAVLTVVVGIGYLATRYLRHLLPKARLAGYGFAALGLIAAAALGFSAARPDGDDASAAEVDAKCVEREQAPLFFDEEGGGGGHPKPFHDVNEPANASDLLHVITHGFVIVRYRPSLSEDDRSSLRDWAEQTQGVVVTPSPMKGAFSAQTSRLNFTCPRVDIEALSEFHGRWLTGASR